MAKNLAVILLVTFVALFAAGCSGTRTSVIAFPDSWEVILLMRYDLQNSDTVAAGAIDTLDEFVSGLVYGHDIETEVWKNDGMLQVELYFANFGLFFEFNNIQNPPLGVDMTVTETFFIMTRELRFPNPWRLLEHNTGDQDTIIDTIEGRINELFTLAPGDNTEYFYVFESRTRRRAPDAHQHINSIVLHSYIFKGFGDDKPYDIVIIDRFANQATWYGLGLLATAIFMGGLYLVLKRRKDDAPSQEQLPPNITIQD